MLEITPAPSRRREFAGWASAHDVRTASMNSFAVPEDLVPQIPEHLLTDAKLDDQPYVPA